MCRTSNYLVGILLITAQAGCGGGSSSKEPQRPIKPSYQSSLPDHSEETQPRVFAPPTPLREPDLPQTCIDALSRIGPVAVPSLENVLRDRNPQLRASAAKALARMGPTAKEAIPFLIQGIQKEPDANVRKQMIRALGQMGELAQDAVPAIVDELRDAVQHDSTPQ